MAVARPELRVLDSTRVEVAHAETIRIGAIPNHVLEILAVVVALDVRTVATRNEAVRPVAEVVICHWNLSGRSTQIYRAPKYGMVLN
ncbi:MAG: hypothetical protein IH960_03925 [Chloroflexi bacterium]|nr:hypothetical protein [Chloroflexota bacterium]